MLWTKDWDGQTIQCREEILLGAVDWDGLNAAEEGEWDCWNEEEINPINSSFSSLYWHGYLSRVILSSTSNMSNYQLPRFFGLVKYIRAVI